MVKRYFEDQLLLMRAGFVSAAFCAVLILVALVDQTQVLGINRWIKPIKFFSSIAIFVWTVAVLFTHLPGFDRAKLWISRTMIVIFTIEMAAVTGQAARGVPSHFNMASPLDGAVFAIMGIAILINTALVGWLFYRYLRDKIDLPPAVVLGIRIGLAVFLLGSLQGMFMSTRIGHAVGAADGGPGLPLVNWSTVAGDLRVAHFIGLHGLQAIPIFAIAANRASTSIASISTVIFAAAYTAFFIFVFVQALNGRPFLSQLF